MTDLALAADFPRPSEEEWLRLVDKAIKGGDFERRLVSRTADGLRIEPLYTRRHAISGRDTLAPGGPPLLRGSRVSDDAIWDMRQICAEPDPVAANVAVLEDLAGGTTSVLLQIAAPGWTGVGYEQDVMARALEGVMLDVAPISLMAGEYTPDAAGSLIALWRAAGVEDAPHLLQMRCQPVEFLRDVDFYPKYGYFLAYALFVVGVSVGSTGHENQLASVYVDIAR